ncbi:MAG TPA: hypothetical protein VIN59_07240 [Alphaproteobacteria bacterium]
MQSNVGIPQEWIEERNRKLDQSKFQTIKKITEMVNGVIYGDRMYEEERALLKVTTLQGHAHYAYMRNLYAFMIGEGQENGGFIGEIIAAKEKEEFRAVVNNHGAGHFSTAPCVDGDLEGITKTTIGWIARNAWLELQFDLRALVAPSNKPMILAPQ